MAFSHADGVAKVLADEKRAMDCYELASLALERRYIESRAQSPGNSIFIAVEEDIKKHHRAGEDPRFVWVDRRGKTWRVGLASQFPIEAQIASHERRIAALEAWAESFGPNR